MRIEESTGLVPFTVLIPADVPDDWSPMSVRYWPGWGRPPHQGPYVYISYSLPPSDQGFGHCSIEESDRPSCMSGMIEWEPMEWAGREYFVSDQGGGSWRLQCFRDGTIVNMGANFELQTLLEVASSLVPAPREPPRLIG